MASGFGDRGVGSVISVEYEGRVVMVLWDRWATICSLLDIRLLAFLCVHLELIRDCPPDEHSGGMEEPIFTGENGVYALALIC